MTPDVNSFSALGIQLPPMLPFQIDDAFMSALQQRIGQALVEVLSAREVRKLAELQATGDSKAVTAWVEQHVPDYHDICQEEFDILLADMAQARGLL